jgi:outer membrane protein TolC
MTIVRHLIRLQVRIEGIAETASVRGQAGVSLDETLAALDPMGRRRVAMLLELVKAFSNDHDQRAAADHIQMRAARAWYGPSVSFSKDPVKDRRTDPA